MFEDAIDLPAAADIVADDRVKYIAAVASWQSTFTHDLFDLVDRISASAIVEAISVDRRRRFGPFGLATFAPYDCPIEYLVDIGELLDGIEPVSSDGKRLVGAPEQLSGNLFAVDLQRELAA